MEEGQLMAVCASCENSWSRGRDVEKSEEAKVLEGYAVEHFVRRVLLIDPVNPPTSFSRGRCEELIRSIGLCEGCVTEFVSSEARILRLQLNYLNKMTGTKDFEEVLADPWLDLKRLVYGSMKNQESSIRNKFQVIENWRGGVPSSIVSVASTQSSTTVITLSALTAATLPTSSCSSSLAQQTVYVPIGYQLSSGVDAVAHQSDSYQPSNSSTPPLQIVEDQMSTSSRGSGTGNVEEQSGQNDVQTFQMDNNGHFEENSQSVSSGQGISDQAVVIVDPASFVVEPSADTETSTTGANQGQDNSEMREDEVENGECENENEKTVTEKEFKASSSPAKKVAAAVSNNKRKAAERKSRSPVLATPQPFEASEDEEVEDGESEIEDNLSVSQKKSRTRSSPAKKVNAAASNKRKAVERKGRSPIRATPLSPKAKKPKTTRDMSPVAHSTPLPAKAPSAASSKTKASKAITKPKDNPKNKAKNGGSAPATPPPARSNSLVHDLLTKYDEMSSTNSKKSPIKVKIRELIGEGDSDSEEDDDDDEEEEEESDSE